MTEKLYQIKGKITIDINEEVWAEDEDEAWEQFWSHIDETIDKPSEVLSDSPNTLKIKRIKEH